MTAARLGIRNPGPPYVEVIRCGRWTWAVRVFHGVTAVAFTTVLGSRARADKVAGRRLAAYLRQEAREARTAHRVTT